MKRELFTILAQCFVLMKESADDENRKRKELMQSQFKVSGSRSGYFMLIDALNNHTINQVVYIWRRSEGRNVPKTFLSKLAKLRIRKTMNDCLEIRYFRMGESTIQFSLHSDNYLGISSTLPYIAFTLNKWYDTAVSMKNPE